MVLFLVMICCWFFKYYLALVLILDGVGNGPSSANNTSSTGSYVPPQPQSGVNGTSSLSNPLVPEIKIREWVWTAANPYRHPEIVVAVPVGWPVPTVHRLWFGTSMGMKILNAKRSGSNRLVTCAIC